LARASVLCPEESSSSGRGAMRSTWSWFDAGGAEPPSTRPSPYSTVSVA
jgi:hypothetical protein